VPPSSGQNEGSRFPRHVSNDTPEQTMLKPTRPQLHYSCCGVWEHIFNRHILLQ